MLENTNYANDNRDSGVCRLAPAVAIIVMTFASWVGVFTVFAHAAQHAPSVPVTTVETIYDTAWR